MSAGLAGPKGDAIDSGFMREEWRQSPPPPLLSQLPPSLEPLSEPLSAQASLEGAGSLEVLDIQADEELS